MGSQSTSKTEPFQRAIINFPMEYWSSVLKIFEIKYAAIISATNTNARNAFLELFGFIKVVANPSVFVPRIKPELFGLALHILALTGKNILEERNAEDDDTYQAKTFKLALHLRPRITLWSAFNHKIKKDFSCPTIKYISVFQEFSQSSQHLHHENPEQLSLLERLEERIQRRDPDMQRIISKINSDIDTATEEAREEFRSNREYTGCGSRTIIGLSIFLVSGVITLFLFMFCGNIFENDDLPDNKYLPTLTFFLLAITSFGLTAFSILWEYWDCCCSNVDYKPLLCEWGASFFPTRKEQQSQQIIAGFKSLERMGDATPINMSRDDESMFFPNEPFFNS